MTTRLQKIQNKVDRLSQRPNIINNLKSLLKGNLKKSLDEIIIIYLYINTHVDQFRELLNHNRKFYHCIIETTHRLINTIIVVNEDQTIDDAMKYPKELRDIAIELMQQILSTILM